MQRKSLRTTDDRAAARNVGYASQMSYEASESAERKALKEKIGKRRPGSRPKKQKQSSDPMDSGLMGGSIRAMAGFTKDKGRSYRG